MVRGESSYDNDDDDDDEDVKMMMMTEALFQHFGSNLSVKVRRPSPASPHDPEVFAIHPPIRAAEIRASRYTSKLTAPTIIAASAKTASIASGDTLPHWDHKRSVLCGQLLPFFAFSGDSLILSAAAAKQVRAPREKVKEQKKGTLTVATPIWDPEAFFARFARGLRFIY